MTQEKKPTPISVDVLAMMVFRLAHGLRKAAPGNDIAEPALDYLARYGRTGTFLRGNSGFVPENVPAQLMLCKAQEAAGTSGSASTSENIPALTEQDAVLLEQAASMLEGLESDERNPGNCSAAEGAGCSAQAVRRLASSLLRAAQAPKDARDVATFEQRLSDWQQEDALDAERYRWLRSRDLETISQGGVFAGMTPQNVILNEEDLDEAVDAAIAAQLQKEQHRPDAPGAAPA